MLLEHDFPGDVRVDKEVQSLFEAGHRIIVASSTSKDLPRVEKATNCTIYRKKISPFILKSSVGALKFPFYFNFWRSFINEIAITEKFDAIHVHDLPLARVGFEFKHKLGVKLVIDLHENYPALLEISQHTNTFIGKLLSSKKQWRNYEVEMANKADALIAVVQEMKERLCNLKIDANKIYVLENTPIVDNKTIEKNVNSDFLTLTYIGGITEARGLQYIIKGMALLSESHKNVRLWIVGDGKYLKDLKILSSNLGVDNLVTFFGKVKSSETVAFLAQTDIALIPHVRSEQSDNSSPNKLYEYMSVGLPVMVSNCTSVERVVKETGVGFSYIHDSPADFKEQLLKIINNREVQTACGENGKRFILTKYNWNYSSRELIRLYSDISIS